jgi:hypothetical protein
MGCTDRSLVDCLVLVLDLLWHVSSFIRNRVPLDKKLGKRLHKHPPPNTGNVGFGPVRIWRVNNNISSLVELFLHGVVAALKISVDQGRAGGREYALLLLWMSSKSNPPLQRAGPCEALRTTTRENQ